MVTTSKNRDNRDNNKTKINMVVFVISKLGHRGQGGLQHLKHLYDKTMNKTNSGTRGQGDLPLTLGTNQHHIYIRGVEERENALSRLSHIFNVQILTTEKNDA